ncbi:MAG: GDSL-type esterase/lipase family protein [Lentisphaerota bacterium]
MNLKKLIENSEYFVWLALGDSITEYNHCTEGYDNYLQHFDQLLRDAYSKRKYTIINSAVSGSSLSDDANFAIDKIRRFKPDFVTAMYGMNDSGRGKAGQEQFKSALNKLCMFCRNSQIPLLLLSQNPLDYACGIDCIRRRELLPEYIDIVKQAGEACNIELIDIHAIWSKDVLEQNNNEHFKLLHDGIHPNHKGHEYIFEIIKKQIYY